MNSKEEHNSFAKLFGVSKKKADEVNYLMDYMVRFLGSSHRKVGHGLKIENINIGDTTIHTEVFKPSLLELYLITGFDPEKMVAFYAHAIGDNILKPKVKVHKSIYSKKK
jgi:hypothetical protein